MENLTHTWLKESWNFYLDNLARILPAVIAFHILATLPSLLLWKYFFCRWYALPYETFIAGPLSIGMNLFFINMARGRAADYGDIFRGFSIFPVAVAVALLYGLITVAGFMLLIVPGIIWGVMYAFSQYAVIDRKTGLKGSFIFSTAITYGYKDSLLFIFMLWAVLEMFSPGVVGATGSLLQPQLVLDLKPWAVTASLLKTFIFLPWLDIAMAMAYVRLVKNYEAERAGPATV